MLPNENSTPDMIKSILQKIIDEMGQLESDRIMPDSRKPQAVSVEIEAGVHKPDEMDTEIDDEELDPAVLGELMTKAGEADETGALPEDAANDLPLEISEAVRRKKELR